MKTRKETIKEEDQEYRGVARIKASRPLKLNLVLSRSDRALKRAGKNSRIDDHDQKEVTGTLFPQVARNVLLIK